MRTSLLVSVFLAVAAIVGSFLWALHDMDVPVAEREAWSIHGTQGDFWGGYVGMGAGVAGTILFFSALVLQSSELKLQREELAESRKVAREQAAALKAQEEQLKRQNRLAQWRDEVQLIMSLAERTWLSGAPGGGEAFMQPVAEFAMRMVLDPSERDPDSALELLGLFVVNCVRVRVPSETRRQSLTTACLRAMEQLDARIRDEGHVLVDDRTARVHARCEEFLKIIKDDGVLPG